MNQDTEKQYPESNSVATLPKPFAISPGSNSATASPAINQLVQSQVHALLTSSPSYHSLSTEQQEEMQSNMEKIASYSAALVHEEFVQSEKLGQKPLLHQTEVITPLATPQSVRTPLAQATASNKPKAEEFSPRAASQVAKITKETLQAISFPTFVADLIKGTYAAIVDASIKQMESYAALLKNVAMTVDEFMKNNISDNQAKDFLQAAHPDVFEVGVSGKSPTLQVRDGADERPKPDFRKQYGLNSDVDINDSDQIDQVLVPAARRMLAKQRQQVLATMVMMGINRIVVTSGRIKASMKFHIDTKDTAMAKSASEFDEKNETTAGVGGGLFSFFGGGHAETKNTISYVSTESKQAMDDIAVQAELNSEVEIKFKSDYLPMERLATPEMMAAIQGNTYNPASNAPPAKQGAPATGTPTGGAGAPPATG